MLTTEDGMIACAKERLQQAMGLLHHNTPVILDDSPGVHRVSDADIERCISSLMFTFRHDFEYQPTSRDVWNVVFGWCRNALDHLIAPRITMLLECGERAHPPLLAVAVEEWKEVVDRCIDGWPDLPRLDVEDWREWLDEYMGVEVAPPTPPQLWSMELVATAHAVVEASAECLRSIAKTNASGSRDFWCQVVSQRLGTARSMYDIDEIRPGLMYLAASYPQHGYSSSFF